MAGGVQIEQRRWCVTVRAPPAPPLVVCLFSSGLSYHNSCHFPSQSFAWKVEGLLWTRTNERLVRRKQINWAKLDLARKEQGERWVSDRHLKFPGTDREQ